MIIKLSNGQAEMRDFVTRKAYREWRTELVKNRKEEFVDVSEEVGGKMKKKQYAFDPVSEENASDVFVLNMLLKLEINGAEAPVTIDSLDALNRKDHAKLLEYCFKLLTQQEEETKK